MNKIADNISLTGENYLKYICAMKGLEYLPPEKRKPANYVELLDDNGVPYILTKDGTVIRKYDKVETYSNKKCVPVPLSEPWDESLTPADRLKAMTLPA